MRDAPTTAAPTKGRPQVQPEMTALFDSFLFLLLVGPSSTEDIRHRVIPFVTGVLEELVTIVACEGDEYCPRPGPRFWINDRCFVVQGLLVDARETFDHFQIFAV